MTPAIELLEKQGISFKLHSYDHDPSNANYGQQAATLLEQNPRAILKTLVCVLTNKSLAVAMVPVSKQLSLKRLAKVLGVKKAELAPPKVVSNVTGYQLGGVSPLGQKQVLTTIVDESAGQFQWVFISAGKRGLELELKLADLIRLCEARLEPIAAD